MKLALILFSFLSIFAQHEEEPIFGANPMHHPEDAATSQSVNVPDPSIKDEPSRKNPKNENWFSNFIKKYFTGYDTEEKTGSR